MCKSDKTVLIQIKSINSNVWLMLACFVGASNSSANNVIPYCVDPNWLPYEAIENNLHIGMSLDYLNILSEHTGYQFNLIETDSWEASLMALKNGQCVLLPMLNQTPERDHYLDFSIDFFKSPNVLVSSDDQPFLHSIENIGELSLGVTQGYRVEEYIKTHHPELNTVSFTTESDGLQAVSNGEVDLFIGSVHSINNLIQSLGLSNLKLAGWGGPDDTLRMGVAKGQQQLLDDINQALAEITKQQHFEIYNHWNDVTVIDNTNYKLIWQISLGGLFILSLLMVRYFSMRNYNQTLTTKNLQLSELQMKLLKSNSDLHNITQHDALTGLYNRHHFNQIIAEDACAYTGKGPLSLILLDLDYFKTVNDNHGHLMGDQVLKTFGALLKSCCNDAELVCRWGGEEFVILKQPANIIEAENLCNKIRQCMNQQVFPHSQPLTCSFGIAQMSDKESLMECFERADKLLYQAKRQGRDQVCG